MTLAAARDGDEAAFAELVRPHRRELHAHCYRMLGSTHDADDALQETLVAAWRGLGGFEGRSSLRTWLYRIATHACLRMTRNRPARILSWDHAPALTTTDDLGAPAPAGIFVEAWPQPSAPADGRGGHDDPAGAVAAREGVELAFVAALQTLPPNQRAVLVLRDVLAFSAAETAGLLDTSVASANSALQRARATLQAAALDRETQRLPAADEQAIVTALVAAWERADVEAIVRLLARDVRFTMPPLPAWFDGRDAVERFLRERVFATPWRMLETSANGRPALAGYQVVDGRALLGSITVVHASRSGVEWFASFVDPELVARFDLPRELPVT